MKKSVTFLTTTLILALALSCSKSSSNKVGSDTVGQSTPSYSTIGYNGVTVSSFDLPTVINNIKAQSDAQGLTCGQQGQPAGARIDYHFEAVAVSQSQIAIQPNVLSAPIAGPSYAVYLGHSAWNDIMIVSKMGTGTNANRFNVTLSMCPYISGNVPFISTNRRVMALVQEDPYTKRPLTTTLDVNLYDGLGSIDAAKNIYLVLDSYNMAPSIKFGPTTFAPVNITP